METSKMSKEDKTEKPRKKVMRRSSRRRGPTGVPEHLIPKHKTLRFVSDNPVNISNKLELGYSVCNAKSPEYKEIAMLIGDRTLADGDLSNRSVISKTGKLGSKLILMEIDTDLYLEGRKELQDEVDRRDGMTRSSQSSARGISSESYQSNNDLKQ